MVLRAFSLIGILLVAACVQAPVALGPDGKPLPQLYRLTENDVGPVQFRMLDGINSIRTSAGHQSLRLNAALNAAAATHSRDMSLQNRPWHFGSDGSSPLDRIERVGYRGKLVGEAISETYESELETLAGWLADPTTRTVIMDPRANEMGFQWFQEPNGRLWWTLVLGEAGF